MRTRYNSMNQQMPIIQNQSLKQWKYQPKTPPIIEIYDLEALEIDSEFSSLSSYSSSNEFNQMNNNSPQQHHMNSLYSSSSASSSPRSSIESNSSFQIDNSLDKPFTFQEFITSIINCNDNKWHTLIIQDLARLLELKFRDFKKEFSNFNQHKSHGNSKKVQQNQPEKPHLKNSYSSVFLNTESDLFTHIAEKIFELVYDEPNGILGAVINLKIICDNDKVYHICQNTPYDHCTFATSEVTITLKEDVTGFKKFLQNFKWYTSLGKYFAMHIDSKDFDITKKRLY